MKKVKGMNVFEKWLFNLAVAYEQFFFSVWVAFDKLWNARTGGDPRETISSRLGKLKEKCGGTIPWKYPIHKFIAWGLDKIQKNHCENSIDKTAGDDAIIE